MEGLESGNLVCGCGTSQRSNQVAATLRAPTLLLWCLHPSLHHVHNIIAHCIEHQITHRVQL